MTKRGKMLSLAVVAVIVGLPTLAVVSWRHSAKTPAFRFLRGQRLLWHGPALHGLPGRITLDIYSWPADFESLCTDANEELSRAGFGDFSHPGLTWREREFCRPGLYSTRVILSREKFDQAEKIIIKDRPPPGRNVPKLGEYSLQFSNTPGWVVVMVEQTRPSLWQSLFALLRRPSPPPPVPPG